MDYKVSPVALDRIDTADRTFKITTQTDTTDLAFSIRAIGLLQPPVLISTGHDYAVVVGFRRIAACQALNMDGIPARILPADTSRVTCSQIAISDNAFQRPLNVVEQSRAFALIQKFCESSSSKLKVVQSTGLPDSQPAMDRIMPVAGMPADLQEAILNGSIALPIALQIIQLEKDNAVALSRLFRKLATGLNIQRELLALISDIAHRDDISMATLIEQDDIAAILENKDSPAPQKVNKLRLMLKSKRYPELSRAEASYTQALKSLKLDPCLQFQPPPYFEGKTYRLTLTIASRRQLKSLQSEIDKLILHPDLIPE